MSELTPEAQAVVDLAAFVAGTEFQTTLATLQAMKEQLPECPSRAHLMHTLVCMSNLANRAPEEEAIYNPPPAPEPVEAPMPPLVSE